MPTDVRIPARLPGLARTLLRAWLPYAERDEILADLEAEFAERAAARGRNAARAWLWRQVLGSAPALLRRAWWRGWTGFDPRANAMKPGGPPMERWIMDLRYAARRLRTRPVYALLAVLTLSLGVGGTAAIFGVVRGILLEPLPYEDEGELFVFWNQFDWSEAELFMFQGEFPGFTRVAGWMPEDVTLAVGDGPPRLVPGVASTAELFDVLGVRPAIGRSLRSGDDRIGAEPVAVVSHGLWQELGGERSIIGRRIELDGVARTVVGVMPRGFWFPDPSVRVWTPTTLEPENQAGNYALIGRRSPGIGAGEMQAALTAITRRLGENFEYSPQWDKTRNPALTPVTAYLLDPVRLPLLATLAAMGVILLIACANVAALMLGQISGRGPELAVRSALGADRRRLVQQIVVEALLVGVLAGTVGAAIAAGAFGLLVSALPLGELAASASLDWMVFWAAMIIAVVAALAVSLVPAVSLARGAVRGTLARSRTGGIGGGSRLESGLVVAEVALAVLLTAGAALLIRSVANLRAIDPGIDTRGIAIVDIAAPSTTTGEQRRQALRDLIPALSGIPGVRSAAAVQTLPLRGGGDNWGVEVIGKPDLPPSTTSFRIVTPAYFETAGIAIVAGRGFEPTDRAGGERVVVINQAMAAKYFPGENPIGQRLSTGFDEAGERIIGIVENVAEGNLTDEAAPARYMLADQLPYAPEMNALLLRLTPNQEPAPVMDAARQTVARVAPAVAVQRVMTIESVFAQAVGPARQVMTLLTLLTALALVLGAVGIYGVTTQFVNRRRREWGIRLALGLTPRRVIAQIVQRGGLLVALGVAFGIVGVVVLARLLSVFLYGVQAVDPVAIVAASAALLIVGVAAAYVPARRASAVDPAGVLREE